MEELVCFVADDSIYGSSPAFYEINRGLPKRVTQEEWQHDLMCARGARMPLSNSAYAELKAACGKPLYN